MSIQLFPVLDGYEKYHFYDRSIDWDRPVDWKSLPQKLEELDRLAERLGVEPITSFVNCSRDESFFDDETIEEFEKEGDLIDGVCYYQGSVLWTVEPKWFSSNQGLISIRSLLTYLRSLQDEQETISEDSENAILNLLGDRGVIFELEQMEKILAKAQQEAKRFRICQSG